MTAVAVPGLDPASAPTTHARLLAWVQEMAELGFIYHPIGRPRPESTTEPEPDHDLEVSETHA